MPSPQWAWAAARPVPAGTPRAQNADFQKLKKVHLLRAMLRECTYLPDSQARSFMKEHVLQRWRVYEPRRDRPPEYIRPLMPYAGARFRTLLRTARKGLYSLERANDGHLKPLLRVLMMTYGRMGKRRYELLRPLTIPKHVLSTPTTTPPVSANARGHQPIHDPITQAISKLKLSTEQRVNLPEMSPTLVALLLSQRKARASSSNPLTRLKSLELEIPELNSWLKPMPANRIINRVKEWYGSVLAKTLPPLPDDEWERLKRLACAEESMAGEFMIPRRAIGSSQYEIQSSLGEVSEDLWYEAGIRQKGSLGSSSHPHVITSRFMRRLWVKVFELCPFMTWESEQKRWNVQWGGLQHARKGLDLNTEEGKRESLEDNEEEEIAALLDEDQKDEQALVDQNGDEQRDLSDVAVEGGKDAKELVKPQRQLQGEKDAEEPAKPQRRPTAFLAAFEAAGFDMSAPTTTIGGKKPRRGVKGQERGERRTTLRLRSD